MQLLGYGLFAFILYTARHPLDSWASSPFTSTAASSTTGHCHCAIVGIWFILLFFLYTAHQSLDGRASSPLTTTAAYSVHVTVHRLGLGGLHLHLQSLQHAQLQFTRTVQSLGFGFLAFISFMYFPLIGDDGRKAEEGVHC